MRWQRRRGNRSGFVPRGHSRRPSARSGLASAWYRSRMSGPGEVGTLDVAAYLALEEGAFTKMVNPIVVVEISSPGQRPLTREPRWITIVASFRCANTSS